jgi:hypothetical protein
VSEGSWRLIDSSSLTPKVRVIAGIAFLPERSLSLALAAFHIPSLASSSSIQWRLEETIEVK